MHLAGAFIQRLTISAFVRVCNPESFYLPDVISSAGGRGFYDPDLVIYIGLNVAFHINAIPYSALGV